VTVVTVTRAIRRLAALSLAVAMTGLLGGCATSGNAKDPIEGFNRAVYAFNEGLDTAIVRPVAVGYDTVMPSPVRTGVSNFFGNVADVFIAVNNLLQGKVPEAASDAGRFLVNTTVGILGLFDVATEIGLEKHNEDFGQTFGRWGVGPGAYMVIPFFGPRDVRDTVGLVLDVKADPIANIGHVPTRNTLLVVRIVSDRANLLPADKVIEEAALDKYTYVRDAYLQRRRSLVYDGNAPREADE
jgi:phospholipid-binding lipoprotein MlaA